MAGHIYSNIFLRHVEQSQSQYRCYTSGIGMVAQCKRDQRYHWCITATMRFYWHSQAKCKTVKMLISHAHTWHIHFESCRFLYVAFYPFLRVCFFFHLHKTPVHNMILCKKRVVFARNALYSTLDKSQVLNILLYTYAFAYWTHVQQNEKEKTVFQHRSSTTVKM